MEFHMQKSLIYKTLIWNGSVSIAVLDTTALVNEAIRRHALTPVAAAALGRTMTATAYLCSWLKADESSLSVTVSGTGAGGKICVAGDGALNLRGFVEHPEADLPLRADGKLDVGGFTGRKGTVTVIRDDGEGIPFVGTSELVSGEIAEDFSAYFLTSEQRPTAIALGVKISPEGKCITAGGLFLQPLPGAGEETIERIEREIGGYSRLSTHIEERGAEGVLRDFAPLESFDTREIAFQCHCSRERIGSLILSLGKEQAQSILRDEGRVSVYCHYCNTTYDFDEEETLSLFAVGGNA